MRNLINLCEESDLEHMGWWFWYHPRTDTLVNVDGTHTLSAAYDLGLYSENYFKDTPDPEDSTILRKAINAGWVRGRYGSRDYEDTSGPWWVQPHDVPEDKRELSLQGTQRNVFLTAKKIINYKPFFTLYVDFTSDEKMDKAETSHLLRGNRLEFFLKNGRILSSMVMESDAIVKKAAKEVTKSYSRFFDNDTDSNLSKKEKREWILNRCYEVLNELEWLGRNGKIPVWRMITAPEDWVPGKRPLGSYWAWKEEAAEAHWGDFSGTHVKWLLHGEIANKDIDWVDTVWKNASPEYEDEKEIRLKDGKKVFLKWYKRVDNANKIIVNTLMESKNNKIETFINQAKDLIDPENGVSISFTKINRFLTRSYCNEDNGVVISFISTVPYERKKGKASDVMKKIISLADQYGIVLCLEVYLNQEERYGALSSEQLSSWYSRLGFKKDGDAMYRLPFTESKLSDVKKYAKELGVSLDLKILEDKIIHLEWIDRFTGKSQIGAGKKVIEKLCAYADRKQFKIQLMVWEGNLKLLDYYKQFGFEQISDDDEPIMERLPKSIRENVIDANPDFKYFKNPSASLLINLTQKSKYKEMRGLAVGNDIYWWDASYGIHASVAKKLGLEYDHNNRLFTMFGTDPSIENSNRVVVIEWVDDWSNNLKSISTHPQTLLYFRNPKIYVHNGSHGLMSGPEFLKEIL